MHQYRYKDGQASVEKIDRKSIIVKESQSLIWGDGMKISDVIENFIKEMMDQAEGEANFHRNELAEKFHCVPSQINYVINSRFTSDHGYIVESKRGGGGSVTIRRVSMDRPGYLMHIVSSVGNAISQRLAFAFIQNFLDYGAISQKEANLMAAAISDNVLRELKQPLQDKTRASILKNMIVSIISTKRSI